MIFEVWTLSFKAIDSMTEKKRRKRGIGLSFNTHQNARRRQCSTCVYVQHFWKYIYTNNDRTIQRLIYQFTYLVYCAPLAALKVYISRACRLIARINMYKGLLASGLDRLYRLMIDSIYTCVRIFNVNQKALQ